MSARTGLAFALVWVMAVQLLEHGPTYYWQVPDCRQYGWYVKALLAWSHRASPAPLAPAVGCAWWDHPPARLGPPLLSAPTNTNTLE